METQILKKRLNTFKSSKGTLRNVSDDVVMDVLRCWEQWTGTAADLYRELGLSKMQLVTMIQKGKRLVKNGIITESEFKEIAVAEDDGSKTGCAGGQVAIELEWDKKRIIRFGDVDELIKFLGKAG